MNRRDLFQLSIIGLVAFAARSANAQALQGFVLANSSENPGNFHRIYGNPELKKEFLLFLTNVYHLYPENKFHDLITEAVGKYRSDKDIYAFLQAHISDIKPFLSELTYALPALSAQKKEIADQTMVFLRRRKKISGYLEIGTPGRYISELEDRLIVEDPIYLVNTYKPAMGPTDIVERGQLLPIGDYLPLADYQPIGVKAESMDVVTNYIGFHHCPLPHLDPFIKSISRSLRKGGSLVLRDHDVTSIEMNAMVALAHDVFNAGLMEKWETNHSELRYFRSLNEWIVMLEAHGLKKNGPSLYQKGDPTKNALIEFVKV
ncbi:MAG: methyltransferase domain-containing protein [Bdellovibrionota bacterium]